MSLIFHPSFQPRIDSLRRRLPHAVLLSGAAGIGLKAIAEAIAGPALYLEPLDSDGRPAPNGSISAARIRGLYEDTRSKHERLVAIIDDADRLTPAAQGAFLKLLEEPSPGTHFILTSHQPAQLLPTIRSRVQHYKIPPITPEQTDELLGSLSRLSAEERAQLRFLAHGRPALIMRYAETPELFRAAANMVRDARTVLSAPERYDRLVAALQYTSRDKALALLDLCITLSRFALRSSSSPDIIAQLDRLVAAHEAIKHNHNPRLQLLGISLGHKN